VLNPTDRTRLPDLLDRVHEAAHELANHLDDPLRRRVAATRLRGLADEITGIVTEGPGDTADVRDLPLTDGQRMALDQGTQDTDRFPADKGDPQD
jgi:chemotaxis regulatin CheY-phosphate phosphatase CheZ